jgi:hypothetical protein
MIARFFLILSAGLVAVGAAPDGALPGLPADRPLPELLSETGLFEAGSRSVRKEVLSYTPQYPLWSDGAAKRRWMYLPPGTSIDATRPEAWEFPPGTRLWKEFGHGGPIETRLIERQADGTWRFGSYVWDAEGTDARLAPAAGIARLPVARTPGERYDIPSQDDCRACHEGSAVPVLGVSALQLSPDRDIAAPHAEAARPEDVDLRELYHRGLLSNLAPQLIDVPPRIAAPSSVARTALGYLHANCGHCHNDGGPLEVLDLVLAQHPVSGSESIARTLHTLISEPSEFRAQGLDTRVVAGRPESSVLAMRMRSRDPLLQMPPLGTTIVDAEGLALIERWIQNEISTEQESIP